MELKRIDLLLRRRKEEITNRNRFVLEQESEPLSSVHRIRDLSIWSNYQFGFVTNPSGHISIDWAMRFEEKQNELVQSILLICFVPGNETSYNLNDEHWELLWYNFGLQLSSFSLSLSLERKKVKVRCDLNETLIWFTSINHRISTESNSNSVNKTE